MTVFDVEEGIFDWGLFNIPPKTRSIPQNGSVGTSTTNGFGWSGYLPPCPTGGELHNIVFTVYALSAKLPSSATADALGKKLKATFKKNIIGKGSLSVQLTLPNE